MFERRRLRRAGVPADVAALVTGLTADSTIVTLVNINQTQSRELIVQMGAYGEHECEELTINEKEIEVESSNFRVRLAPGCGATLTLETERYENAPTLLFPWDQH